MERQRVRLACRNWLGWTGFVWTVVVIAQEILGLDLTSWMGAVELSTCCFR